MRTSRSPRPASSREPTLTTGHSRICSWRTSRFRQASRCTINSGLSAWNARQMDVGASRSRMSSSARRTGSLRNSSSSAPAAARCRCCRSHASPKRTATAAFQSAASGCAATSCGEQPPSRQGLWQGGGRIATNVGSAPRHTHHRRHQVTAVRTICRVFDAVPQAWLAHRPVSLDRTRQHPADAGGRT